jgi:hypothetical protein
MTTPRCGRGAAAKIDGDGAPSIPRAIPKKQALPKRSRVEKLLDEVRHKPSPTCRDPRQLDLIEYAVDKQKRQGFARLDAAIAETLDKEDRRR